MDPAYTFAFLHLFDLILLVGLVHYYRRLGHGFLKYGAIALGVAMLGQILEYRLPSFDVVPGPVEAVMALTYAGIMLVCVADIGGRPLPLRWISGSVVLLAVAMAVNLYAVPIWWLPVLMLPAVAILAVGVYMLWRYRQERSLGAFALAGMLILQAGLILVPATTPARYAADIAYLLVALALLMITSERAILELTSRDRRLEQYAAERARLQLQFSQAQKLESLGVLAGGIAHDFNNMLTSILGYASLAMKKLPPDSEVSKDLYMVMSGARQAVDLTSQMLTYAGKGIIESEALDISKVVEDMGGLINSIVPGKIQLVQRLARDLPAMKGDKVQLGQVVMNLVANAVDAIEDGVGVVEVATGIADVDERMLHRSFFAQEREPGAYLYLKVKDSGIGMSDDQVHRIFDPFYSDKQTRRGLGLASLSGTVRQHKGFIQVQSAPGHGSEFAVYFPAVAYQEVIADERYLVANDEIRGKILVADDDPRIRSLMVSILEAEHYGLVSTEDGRDALRRFEEEPGEFDMLVLDCTMPKLSGSEVYQRIRSKGSRVPVVLISGYHQEQVATRISGDPNAYFLKKPFNVDEFIEQVRTAISDRGGVARINRTS